MDLATLELLSQIDLLAIIVILGVFCFCIPVCRTHWSWPYFLPLVALILYVPYEMYFNIEEVSLGVPIRVDLMLLLPGFGSAFPVSALMWGLIARRRKKEGGDIGVFVPVMTAVMLVCTVGWPVYVVMYLMGG